MSMQRRHFTGAQKLAVLREHLIEKVPLSEVCRKHEVSPTLFYQWQKRLFEEGGCIFESKAQDARQQTADAQKLAAAQGQIKGDANL